MWVYVLTGSGKIKSGEYRMAFVVSTGTIRFEEDRWWNLRAYFYSLAMVSKSPEFRTATLFTCVVDIQSENPEFESVDKTRYKKR
jgi:hypothetical protein